MKTRISQFLFLSAAVVLLLTATGYDRPADPNLSGTCIEILFLNAGNHTDHQPQTVYVSLKDPNGQLQGSDGTQTTTWTAENGRMELSLPVGTPTSQDLPYRFWIKADAEGFLYNMQAVEVRPGTHTQTTIYLVDMKDAEMQITQGPSLSK